MQSMRNALKEEQRNSKRFQKESKFIWDNKSILDRDYIWTRSYRGMRTLHDQRGECIQGMKHDIQCYRSTKNKQNKKSVGCWEIVQGLKAMVTWIQTICLAKGKPAKI